MRDPGRHAGTESPPRLVADAMLGRLARWLRRFGVDVLWDPGWDDAELERIAALDGRLLLTRDRLLAARTVARESLLVASDDLRVQLRQVFARLGLDPARPPGPRRCAHCNAVPEPARAEDLAGRAPPYVLRTARRLSACPGCGRVYWDGGQEDRAREVLGRLLGSSGSPES
ncbi:MAG: hypothetical protein Kow0062_18310 [Acidobacteriota bacterium]